MGEGTEDEFYEISAVSRLTGLSTHVLRVWERRYSVVDPSRTDTKRRQYSRLDIQRLTLLKSLVDNGHTISSVAKLDIEALEERLAGVLKIKAEQDEDKEHCRIGLVAVQARKAVREAAETVESLTVTAEFPSVDKLVKNIKPGAVDILIVEEGSLFTEGLIAVREAIDKLNATRAIVIYQFAAEEVLSPGNIEKITALRAPVTSAEILLACAADVQLARTTKIPLDDHGSIDIPARLFTNEQLVTIGKRASVVDCECPQHISSLLDGLNSFETYSRKCESRSPEDAELHAFLYKETAECRHAMEKALMKVLKAEGIEI